MRGLANECGSRNSFGYYDASAKEIILKRPCLKKQDLEEAYLWLDNSLELRKFSIGIGSVEVLSQTAISADFIRRRAGCSKTL